MKRNVAERTFIMTGKNLPMTVCAPLCKLLTFLIAFLFLALPTSAHAVEITYTGDGKELRNSPSWFSEEVDFSLFPGSEKTPLPSGNGVTIDYDPSAVGVTNPELVLGGFSKLGDVSDNRIIMLSGQVKESLLGGLCHDGDAKRNMVTVSGGSVDKGVIGGFSLMGGVADNSAIVTGGSISECAIGGFSLGDIALRNIVTISGGHVGGYVYGGVGKEGAADNSVTISGGSVEAAVLGGISEGKDATGNTVTVIGGSVKGKVYGGESDRSAAAGNSVTISGGFVEGNVCGGWTYKGNATNNTVTISGKPNLAKAYIWGGQDVNESVDTFTGNILNFKSSGVSVKGVGNFEYYNFYLPESAAAGGIMLSVADAVDLKGTTVQISLQDGCKLNKGDKIALIYNAAGVSSSPKNKSRKAQQGDTLYEFSIYADSNNLWAKVTKISSVAQ